MPGTTCRSTYNDVSGEAYVLPCAQIGQVCAAQYSGTGEWHRCYIVDINKKEAQVIDKKYLVHIMLML